MTPYRDRREAGHYNSTDEPTQPTDQGWKWEDKTDKTPAPSKPKPANGRRKKAA